MDLSVFSILIYLSGKLDSLLMVTYLYVTVVCSTNLRINQGLFALIVSESMLGISLYQIQWNFAFGNYQ